MDIILSKNMMAQIPTKHEKFGHTAYNGDLFIQTKYMNSNEFKYVPATVHEIDGGYKLIVPSKVSTMQANDELVTAFLGFGDTTLNEGKIIEIDSTKIHSYLNQFTKINFGKTN